MSAIKTLALGVLVLGALAPSTQGASMGRGWRHWLAQARAAQAQSAYQRWLTLSFYPTVLPSYAPTTTSPWSMFSSPTAPAIASPPTPTVTLAAAPATPQAMSVASPNGLFRASGPATVSVSSPPPPPLAFHTSTVNTVAPAAPAYSADAFINLGSGPFAGLGSLATGNAQPWYLSPSVIQVYHGVPTTDQQQQFADAVLQHVQQTYQQSGLNVTLTEDPNAKAAHTLSVVSGVSNPSNPDAVGMTQVGYDGMSFIDKLKYAQSPEELEWVVAHNVAHELMHAFGGEHHDTTGQYLDAAVTPWNVLADSGSVFGPDSVAELKTRDFLSRGNGVYDVDGAAMLAPPHPVPEPATVLLWASAAGGLVIARRRRVVRAAA